MASYSSLSSGKKFILLAVFSAAAYLLLVLTGCSAQSRTTRTVTTSESGQNAGMQERDAGTGETTTSVTTEETSTSARSSDGGIMGGAFHLVGEVLAFPFRVIAAVFDGIF